MKYTVEELFEAMQNSFQVHHPKFPFPKKDLEEAPDSFRLAFTDFANDLIDGARKDVNASYGRGEQEGYREGVIAGKNKAKADAYPAWLLIVIGLVLGWGGMLLAIFLHGGA